MEINPGALTSIALAPVSDTLRDELSRAALQASWGGILVVGPPGVGPVAHTRTFGKLAVVYVDPSRCSAADALRVMLDGLEIKAEQMKGDP